MSSANTNAAGAGISAAGGFVSSFTLAACCAIPMAFSAIGLGTAWLVPIVAVGTAHGSLLTGIAIVSILMSVGIMIFGTKTCQPGDLCSRLWFRVTIYGVAVISALLLVASYIYE